MTKSKAVAQKQMGSKSGKQSKRSPLWIYTLVGGLALAIAVGLLVGCSQSRPSSPTAGSPASGAPLSMAAVGKPAPGFYLPNQYGGTYTLTPGDGKNHLLVFYMGNF
jgi:cytochrome oxidase Cu insertion factor (SCO1/SenC/PrrC family)